MSITPNQIQLTQEYRKRLKNDLVAYENAPEDIKELFDELWQSFKEVAKFDDDNQADLAAFGALSQFAILLQSFDKDELPELLTVFSVSVLNKVKKGDRLD